MSCFECLDDTITAVVALATGQCIGYDVKPTNPLLAPGSEREDFNRLGEQLKRLNWGAIHLRYGDPIPEDLSFTWKPNHVRPLHVCHALKSLDCLLYQCSVDDNVRDPLYKRLEQLRADICRQIVRGLPEYEQADAWH